MRALRNVGTYRDIFYRYKQVRRSRIYLSKYLCNITKSGANVYWGLQTVEIPGNFLQALVRRKEPLYPRTWEYHWKHFNLLQANDQIHFLDETAQFINTIKLN